MYRYFCLPLSLTLFCVSTCFTGADVSVNISAAVGQDCVLPCTGLKDCKVRTLVWTWSDHDKVLLVFKRGTVKDGYQHLDYTDRVQLLDPQLHTGNLSVVLKNVRLEDRGTYQCRSSYEDRQDISQSIHLTVTEQQQHRDTTTIRSNTENTLRRLRGLFWGLVVGLSVVQVIIVAVIVLLKSNMVNLKQIKRSQLGLSGDSKEPRERRHHSVSSTSTSSSQESDSSTKPLIHPHRDSDMSHLAKPPLDPLPPFNHPLLPSSSPSSTLSRSSSDSNLLGSDPEIAISKSPTAHSSPNMCLTE